MKFTYKKKSSVKNFQREIFSKNHIGQSMSQLSSMVYGIYELWVVTKIMRSQIQAAKKIFLHRVAGLSLRDRVKSLDIQVRLRVEPLLQKFRVLARGALNF